MATSFVVAAGAEPPAHVEVVEGQTRLVLTARAAERLGIQTVAVRRETYAPTITVAGVVVVRSSISPKSDDGTVGAVAEDKAWVQLVVNDLPFLVDPAVDAVVTTLRSNATGREFRGRPVPKQPERDITLLYSVTDAGNDLVSGEPVLVTLTGKASARDIAPYASIVYDENGGEWLYVSLGAETFVREPVTIERIEAGEDLAILSNGPPHGTAIVSVGAAELYGAETGVGH